MFLIISHFTHIYLHLLYRMLEIQLSTAATHTTPTPCSPSDANHRWYKQMQSLNHLHVNTDDSDE